MLFFSPPWFFSCLFALSRFFSLGTGSLPLARPTRRAGLPHLSRVYVRLPLLGAICSPTSLLHKAPRTSWPLPSLAPFRNFKADDGEVSCKCRNNGRWRVDCGGVWPETTVPGRAKSLEHCRNCTVTSAFHALLLAPGQQPSDIPSPTPSSWREYYCRVFPSITRHLRLKRLRSEKTATKFSGIRWKHVSCERHWKIYAN